MLKKLAKNINIQIKYYINTSYRVLSELLKQVFGSLEIKT